VEQLEVLVLLYESPAKEWSVAEVSQRLYTSEESALSRLRDMTRAGLITELFETPHSFRYEPRTAELRSIIDAVIKAYRERRVSVISTIYCKPTKQLQAFSDAFRIFHKKGDDAGKKEGG
jgi:hypothetical protein